MNTVYEDEALLSLTLNNNKKLRRLPHVFSSVLELPFTSDVDVSVQELPHSFRFIVVADTPRAITHLEARTLHVHPGLTVTKILLNQTGFLHELDLNIWRFRLPESTRPELATADVVDGELIVTVPKEVEADDLRRRENRGMDGTRTLVLLQ